MKDPQIFLVGVFEHRGPRGIRLASYTRYFNTSWDGCCVHSMTAHTGTQAKRMAEREHRDKCMPSASTPEAPHE